MSSQTKVTAQWDSMAGEWDDVASGYGVAVYRLLKGMLANEVFYREDNVNNNQKPIVIDFGCGTGILTEKIQKISSNVIAIDASTQMIELLLDKIRDYDWMNVKAHAVVLAHLDETSFQQMFQEIEGSVDLIISSSVFSYIPPEDYDATMIFLGRLLKEGGYFFLTEVSYGDKNNNPNLMTNENARNLFNAAGLQVKKMQIITLETPDKFDTFVAVAVK